jgi:hypothetical protein
MAKPIEIHIDASLRKKFLARQVRITRRGEWECWIWQGHCDQKGYGRLACRQRSYKAHRVSYEMFIGSIPPGLVIDHLCRTRNCVNPENLEPVTNVENIRRGESVVTVQAKKTHCIHGHPFFGDNVRIDVTRRRGRAIGLRRRCKTCARQRDEKVRERKRQLAPRGTDTSIPQ